MKVNLFYSKLIYFQFLSFYMHSDNRLRNYFIPQTGPINHIGDMFIDTDSIQISGESIGFTKYDESSKSTVKHIMQWYNYVQDPSVLNKFIKVYGPILGNGVTKALSKGIQDEIN